MLATSGGGEVELAVAEKTLNTTKRRLYDVVNVLAGVGLLEKCGKAKVRWIGSTPDEMGSENIVQQPNGPNFITDINPVSAQTEREQLVDQLLESVEQDITDLLESDLSTNFSWLSYSDVLDNMGKPGIHYYAVTGSKTMLIEKSDQGMEFSDPLEKEIELLDLGIMPPK